MILAKKEDILKYYSTDKIDQQANALNYWKAMELRFKKKWGARRISKLTKIPEGAVHYWLRGYKPKSVNGLVQLEKMGLLPLKATNDDSFKHFMHTLGLRYADGCIYEQKRNNSFTFYLCFGNKIDALNYIRDTKRIWKIDLVEHFSSRAYYVYLPASLARLFIHVGSPVGKKISLSFCLPKWIFKLSTSLKWEFISGLFSGDGAVPKLKPYGACCESLRLSLSSEKSIVESFRDNFMKALQELLLSLNVKVSLPKIMWNNPRVSKDGCVSYPIEIRILTQKNNMVHFLRNISYRYCNKADSRVKNIIEILNGENQISYLKNYFKKQNSNVDLLVKILLKKEYINKLIEDSAEMLQKQRGKYKKLAMYLKNNCKSMRDVKIRSIKDGYLSNWKNNKIFIPFDCLIKLLKLCKRDIKGCKIQIEKISYKNVNQKYAINFE